MTAALAAHHEETRSLDATGIQAALAGSLPFSENVMWRCA